MDRNRKHITGCQGLGWRGRGGLEAPMARVKVKLTISSDFKIYDFKICNHQWGNWKVFNSCQVCALAKYTTLFLVKDRIPPSPHHKRKKQKKWVTTLRFSFHVYLHVTDFFLSFFKYKFIYFNWRSITLQYWIGFAIHQHVDVWLTFYLVLWDNEGLPRWC